MSIISHLIFIKMLFKYINQRLGSLKNSRGHEVCSRTEVYTLVHFSFELLEKCKKPDSLGTAVSWLYVVLICKSSDIVTVQLIKTLIKHLDKGCHSSPIQTDFSVGFFARLSIQSKHIG